MKQTAVLLKPATEFHATGVASKSELSTEIATASAEAGSTRPVYNELSHAGMTPTKLAGIISAAKSGDADEYLALAEVIEEADVEYRALLSTRKGAVCGLPLVVEAASDAPADVQAAELVREVLAEDWVNEALYDALDALGKGYSVQEIVWNTKGAFWRPSAVISRPQQFFFYDKSDGRTLLLKDINDKRKGSPLPAYKFLVHTPKMKTGLPIRSGLALVAAWTWLISSITNKNWLSASETEGKPWRVGKFAPGTPKEDVLGLKHALGLLGSDAYAVLPSTMQIEFLSGSSSDGAIFEKLARYFGELKAKLVLGQTKTSDGTGGSNALAQTHNEVRLDIVQADAKALAATLKRDLVTPLVKLNFGDNVGLPTIRFHLEDSVDIISLATALEKLVPLGLQVEASVIRDKLGLPDPAAGAELLSAPAAAPANPFAMSREAAGVQHSQEPTCPVHDAHSASKVRDSLDDTTDDLVDQWSDLLPAVRKQMQASLAGVTSTVGMKQRLLAFVLEQNNEDLVRLLADARATAKAVGAAAGDIGDGVK